LRDRATGLRALPWGRGEAARTMGRMSGALALRRLALVLFAALVGTAVALVADASAQPTGEGIRPGRSMLVFHDIDFVAALGYRAGDPMRIELFRGDHRIGATAGPAQDTPDGGGLEVNHGVDGTAAAWDCWLGTTPDLQPYDRIVVTDPAGRDELLVDDLRLTQGPTLREDGSLTLEGHARLADGTPVPIAALHGEARLSEPRVRAETTNVERIPVEESGSDDAFRVVYTHRNPGAYTLVKPGGTPSQAHTNLLLGADEHAVGYGHTEPLPPETQMADFGGTHGPAAGCEQLAPAAAPDAITSRDDEVVNRSSGDLELSGTASAATTAVQVTLDDSDPATEAIVLDTVPEHAPGAPADAEQGWSVEVPREVLERLADGTLVATPAFTGAGPITARTVSIAKDTVVPQAPTADPAPGTHVGPQTVTLAGEAGARVHVTQDGTAASAASPRRTAVEVDSSRTLRAVAVDAAGNESSEAVLEYVIVDPRPAPVDSAPPAVEPPVVWVETPGLQPVPPTLPAPAPKPLTRPAAAGSQPLRATRVTVGSRQRLRTVSRRGLTARVVAPSGTRLVEIAVYRVQGTRRALVGRRTLGGVAGVNLVGLRPQALRRARSGRYEVVVRVGRRSGALGPATRVALRIVS
jgi:hypothetical protein